MTNNGSAWVFEGTPHVKPIPVTFGGVSSEAIEIMQGPAAGVYVRVGGDEWLRAREIAVQQRDPLALHRTGALQCDSCTARFHFPVMHQIFSFPFVPLPGWMVWGCSALAQPTSEPQELKVRVMCDRCSKLRAGYVRDLFAYGRALAREGVL